MEYNTINHILVRNKEVEDELRSKTTSHSLVDCSIQHFLDLKPVTKLYDFIHVRNFLGKQFQKSKLICPGQTLNKTLKGLTSAQAIEQHSSEENPCLVWLAWKFRTTDILMKTPTKPDAPSIGLRMPEFTVTGVGQVNETCSSEYL